MTKKLFNLKILIVVILTSVITYVVLVYSQTFTCKTVEKCKLNKDDVELLKKYKNMVHDLQKDLKQLQERIKICSGIENKNLQKEISSTRKYSTELSRCIKTEGSLREQLIEEKDERIKEKNHLVPFSNRLDVIHTTVENIISIGREQRDLIQEIMEKTYHPFTASRIIHIDFKGAPPLLPYLIKMLKQIKDIGGNGLLLEYEDMFPWKGALKSLRREIHYSETEIECILQTAHELGLEIIPSIPSLTYMDFVLKQPKYAHLREHKNSTRIISPSNPESSRLIKEMINQILEMHPKSEWIHIGAQQVRAYNICQLCKATEDELLSHMITLFKYVGTFRNENKEVVKPIIWDDMLRKWPVYKLQRFSQLVVPMVSGYSTDVENETPKVSWDRYDEAFKSIWIASSYKGVTRPWTNLVPAKYHIDNNLSWLKIAMDLKLKNIKVLGIVLTGWSRYDHYAPLTELYPVALPSLALCLAVLKQGSFDGELHKKVSMSLNFEKLITLSYDFPRNPSIAKANYDGSEVLRLVEKREKAVGYDGWAKMRQDGWSRPYYIERNILNYFYLNKTLRRLYNGSRILKEVKLRTSDTFKPFLFQETINEWIGDKVDDLISTTKQKIESIEKVFRFGKFP